MNFRWFFSKTVRDAVAVRKHFCRLLAAQRDLLSPQAIGAVTAALNELDAAIAHEHKGKVRVRAEELQFAAEKWLKPYPNPAWRENIEVLLVALAVAMGIRTFFLQPFKIPTGSMQPTLYGVTSVPDFSPSTIDFWADQDKIEAEAREQARLRDSLQIPTGWERIKEWFEGTSYIHVVAENDGTLQIGRPFPPALFRIFQPISVGGRTQYLWFPPDLGEQSLARRAGLDPQHYYHKGDEIIKMKVNAGDHLFVDRLTYNFRQPKRGEIVVFQTAGIPKEKRDPFRIPGDEFYIKRLIALPGERVQIGDDRHVIINGRRLDASTPHFENVYGFNPGTPPRKGHFSGHVNGYVATEYGLYPDLAPLFPNGATVYTNVLYDVTNFITGAGSPVDSYMVFGDNTCDSLDSRAWGPFPARSVIGKAFFVYWPLTSRFGWGNR